MNKTKQQLHVIFIEQRYIATMPPVESKQNVWEFHASPLLFAAAYSYCVNISSSVYGSQRGYRCRLKNVTCTCSNNNCVKRECNTKKSM